MKMCLDCGAVDELEGDMHSSCPTPSRPIPGTLVEVRVEECPVRGSDRRTKRYRDNVCDSEHHHYGRGDHVVILPTDGDNPIYEASRTAVAEALSHDRRGTDA